MPKLNGREVGPIGYGMMGLTWRPEPAPQEQAFAAMRAALDAGCNFFNGGEFYGTKDYNSAILLERYLAAYPEDAERIVLSIKGCLKLGTLELDGGPDGVRRSLDNTLKQLKGSVGIELFECSRRDVSAPLADSLGTMRREYIEASPPKLGAISLSEVSAATIHEAVAAGFTIAAVEVELSLWATDVLTNGVAAACAQYDIPLVAYSPIGRGVLAGELRSPDQLNAGDFRRFFPRFQPEAFAANLKLVDQIKKLADAKGCTSAQLAINWVRSLAGRPGLPKTIIPIPGATTVERVRENATIIEITDAEMDEIDATLAQFEVQGGRYPDGAPTNT